MGISVVVAGGGIGGLAAALACARVGAEVCLLEQAHTFCEVGAGVQLGPNVVRVLQSWGLGNALSAVAAFPLQLQVRDASSARVLGVLPLGAAMTQRYQAPYATVARADLHQLLLDAVQPFGNVQLALGRRVQTVSQSADAVHVQASVVGVSGDRVQQGLSSQALNADVLVGADGLWSQVRSAVVGDSPARQRGHLAYRAMVAQADLPPRLRSQIITLWLGPHFHVVQYPVRGGQWLNVVVIVQGPAPADLPSWDHSANAFELRARLLHAGPVVSDLLHAIEHWRLWPLYERAPMRSAAEHAQGRIVLVGDAAHPMLPYLAQGAGMAIEDAATLEQALAPIATSGAVPGALQAFAHKRWQRNARVQARAMHNADIFHWSGFLRWARDTALRLCGARLLEMRWLYRG